MAPRPQHAAPHSFDRRPGTAPVSSPRQHRLFASNVPLVAVETHGALRRPAGREIMEAMGTADVIVLIFATMVSKLVFLGWVIHWLRRKAILDEAWEHE